MSSLAAIQKQIAYVREKKQAIERKESDLVLKLQQVCSHPAIERGGGDHWFSYPEYGTNPHWMRCKVCGLRGSYPSELGTPTRTNWEILDEARHKYG